MAYVKRIQAGNLDLFYNVLVDLLRATKKEKNPSFVCMCIMDTISQANKTMRHVIMLIQQLGEIYTRQIYTIKTIITLVNIFYCCLLRT